MVHSTISDVHIVIWHKLLKCFGIEFIENFVVGEYWDLKKGIYFVLEC